MGMLEAIRTCFAKYATFSGRASRPEFWWFLLAYGVVLAFAALLDKSVFGADVMPPVADAAGDGSAAPATPHRRRPAEVVVWLVFFLPLLAAAWRRMQDTGRSGATLLIPIAISLATGAFLFLGVFGFGLLELIGLDGQALRILAAALGIAGIVVAGVLNITMRVLILWWLAQPSQPEPNQYGLRPAK